MRYFDCSVELTRLYRKAEAVAFRYGTFLYDDIEIKYRFRPRQKDAQHLIVIFSGFRDLGTLDFAGSVTESLRANLLWIYDEFDDMSSYYQRAFGGRDITPAVLDLIENARERLGLKRHEVTLLGFSKGGTAALYYGIKFGYPNIVASVPQYRAGTFMANNFHRHLANVGGPSMIEFLDESLDKAIDEDPTKGSRNIYLLTSPSDDQYDKEVLPLARALCAKYQNVNLIIYESQMIRKHAEVSRYAVPVIVSLLALLTEGFVPRLESSWQDESRQYCEDQFWSCNSELRELADVVVVNSASRASDVAPLSFEDLDRSLVMRINRVPLNGGILFPDGYAYFKGVCVDRYREIHVALVIHSGTEQMTVALAGAVDDNLSLSQFCGRYVDYSHAGLTTYAHRGIDLKGLPFGRYAVRAVAQQGDLSATLEEVPVLVHEQWTLLDDRFIGTRSSATTGWEILCLPVIGRTLSDSYTEEVRCEVRESLLFVEGYFVPRGRSVGSWREINYSLSLVSASDDGSLIATRSFELAAGRRLDCSTRSGEPWRDQCCAYYATRRYGGVLVTGLAEGRYDMYVTARVGDDVRSFRLAEQLQVECGVMRVCASGVASSND